MFWEHLIYGCFTYDYSLRLDIVDADFARITLDSSRVESLLPMFIASTDDSILVEGL